MEIIGIKNKYKSFLNDTSSIDYLNVIPRAMLSNEHTDTLKLLSDWSMCGVYCFDHL